MKGRGPFTGKLAHAMYVPAGFIGYFSFIVKGFLCNKALAYVQAESGFCGKENISPVEKTKGLYYNNAE